MNIWIRRCGIAMLLACAGLLLPAQAWAQVQARVDRNPVDLGETFVLSLASSEPGQAPDLGPLMRDFELVDQSSSQSVQIINGRQSARVIYRLTLEPRRAGELTVPSLLIGGARSAPIALTVRPAPPVNTRDGKADIFLETEVDDTAPYIQQSVGVVLRLYYAVPLLSGELDLAAPDGALLQKVGDDVQGSREINGRRYNMVERRFLLVPERSGPLSLPGPRFKGRGAGGWFDDLIGGNGRELRAAGPSRPLQVRAQPANAPQPWLPLRDLRLRYAGAPTRARAGEAASVVIEGIAQGATQAQMPEIPAPSVPGAQVFPEPPQYDESFNGGTPQVKWTQRYAVVPDRAGQMTVSGLRMPWWDVKAGTARVASLPDLVLPVAAAAAGSASAVPALPAPGDAVPGNGDAAPLIAPSPVASASAWMWLAVAFAVLWLLTLLWALQRRRAPVAGNAAGPGNAAAGSPRARHGAADLKRALAAGTLDDVANVLCGLAQPPVADLDALIARLQPAEQRDAVEQLRRARWAAGDGVAARAALRRAFAEGPRWIAPAQAEAAPLPPLYPQR